MNSYRDGGEKFQQKSVMTEYSNRVAIGIGHPDRSEIEADEETIDFEGVVKDFDDIKIDDIPEGESVEELVDDIQKESVEDQHKVIDKMFGSTGEYENDEDVDWAPQVALAKFDPDVVDPDLVSIDRLRERAEEDELEKSGEVLEDDATQIEQTVAKATSIERRHREKSTDEAQEQQIFREAISLADEMADSKKEAAELAARYVKEARDDPELAVKARQVAMDGFDKARQYVSSDRDAPADAIVREGPHGALYYDPDERGQNDRLGPHENSLLDMDADELERMMEVDPNDPDNWEA